MKTTTIFLIAFLALIGSTTSISAQNITKGLKNNFYSYQGQLYHFDDLELFFIKNAQNNTNVVSMEAYNNYTESKRKLSGAKVNAWFALGGIGVGTTVLYLPTQNNLTGLIEKFFLGTIGGGLILTGGIMGLISLGQYSIAYKLRSESIKDFNNSIGLYGNPLPQENNEQVELKVISKDGLGLRLTF